jgi:cytoskeletal protein RodZ
LALRNVGEFLSEARISRNLSIVVLSSSLRIGTEQLIALESGDESALPEKVFIRAMVRRIAEKLNLDTSFILEELNEKKNNDASNTTVINKESPNNNQKANPLRMVIFSGILGLLTSIMVLKYIERSGNDSINPKTSEIFLLDKNIYF